MNRTTVTKNAKRLALGLAVLALAAAPSFAVELAAVPAQWSPDGGVTQIDMWGFVEVPDAASYTCPGAPVTWEIPVLSEPAGALTINVTNCLADDISIFIPGLAKDAADALAPQTTTDGQGRERLTSFDDTVGWTLTGSYTWVATEGTYLYHSGTDIRTQVPMGLYGALVVTGAGYPTVAQDEVLVFSEIDPNLNADPANFGGARVTMWNPQHFLINGLAYDATNPPVATIGINEDVLLRFVNAGLETFVPTFDGGLYMELIAEDGNLSPHPIHQYGLELQAGKTIDAIVNVGSAGTYALYDRALHLANGGLVAEIEALAPGDAPIAVNDGYSVVEDSGANVIPAPGVLVNDTPGTGPGPFTANLVSDVSSGILALSPDGSFTYTPNADFAGGDVFTYVANDGALDSNVATVNITVTPVNDPPGAAADAYDALEGLTLSVPAPGVLANDSDPDGDTLTVTTTPLSGPSNGVLTLNADGSFDYTPNALYVGPDSFTYEVCDPVLLCSSAAVAITVNPTPNVPPIADDDFGETQKNTLLANFDILANDQDPDGTIEPTSVVITTGPTTQRGGTVTVNPDGTVNFDPKNGFRGTDTFQYTVDDTEGATSNVATVIINVVN